MLIVLEKAGAVFEIGILESKLPGAVVHARNEGLLRAAKVLRHRNGAVVCRNDADALEHFVNAHLFALLEKNAASAEGCCALRGYDRVVKAYIAALDGLDDQKHGHDLRNACRRQALVRILLVYHFARDLFHEYCRRGGDVNVIVCKRIYRIYRTRQHDDAQRSTQKFFHSSSLR